METHEGWNRELELMVQAEASQAGFSLVGVAAAAPDGGGGALEGERFKAWVSAGRAGEMEYLKRRDADGNLLRSALQVAIPWARSVVVCAFNYGSGLPKSIDPAGTDRGWIGRYAWSGKSREADSDGGDHPVEATDYHDELLTRLKAVETCLLEHAPCESRCYVDTGPIVERGFAARAGVGWIAKNTCVINEELGSWLLLGVIVTSLPVSSSVAELAAADRCGSCTRCIDACPTDALVAPREMDASRCIAYLTIEKKGSIAEELRAGMGRQVFGCDICQDVCPWNERGGRTRSNSERATSESERARSESERARSESKQAEALDAKAIVHRNMEPRSALVNPSLEWLAGMDAKEFKRWFKGSPLERTGRRRLHRNVAIAMGNSGETGFLPRLRVWAQGDDEVLAEAAAWAIGRIKPAGPDAGALC